MKRYLIIIAIAVVLSVGVSFLITVQKYGLSYYTNFTSDFMEAELNDKRRLALKYHKAKEYDKARVIYEELAEKEHAVSLYHLGVFYYYGLNVAINKQTAMGYFQRSSNAGDRTASHFLATKYECGGCDFSKKDLRKAFDYYLKSANQSGIRALAIISVLYHYGIGTKIDDAKAFEWAELAAASTATGKAILASYYIDGVHVQKDTVKGEALMKEYKNSIHDEKYEAKLLKHICWYTPKGREKIHVCR